MMKRNFRSLVTMSLIAGSLVMYSCKETKQEEKEETPAEHQMHSGEDMSDKGEETGAVEDASIEFNDEKTAKLFEDYIAIKDALVQTDASATKKAALDLKAELDDSQKEIAALADKIAGTDDVNKQREVFSELTKAMDPVLKGAISSGKIYKQFCPMAFEGKGDYWYSDSEQIRNPYFGDKMLKCGRVDETIM